MARKKKHPEHVNHERWLISYADFITLLFAFFVVMFAASNADQKKAGQVAQAVQVAFQDLSMFSPAGKVIPLYDTGGAPSDSKTVIDNNKPQLVSPAVKPVDGDAQMKQVKAELEMKLQNELANHSVRLFEDGRGVTISLAEAGFFDAGSAVIHPQALAVIDRIAATLAPQSFNIRVEGHTDDMPIHTAQFPSNWELSTGRATFLLQYLISKASIPPERMSAVGYGQYRPVSPNATVEGRAANRRVDLVVLGPAAQKQEPTEVR